MMFVLVKYLSEDLNYTDQKAGWAYGVFGMVTSLFGVIIGIFVDSMGVRISLLLGLFTSTIGRFFLTFASADSALFLLLTVLPIGASLCIPVMSLGIRRFTTIKGRPFAFSIFCVLMNISATIAGFAITLARFVSKNLTSDISQYKILLISSFLMSFIASILCLKLREIKVSENDLVEEFVYENYKNYMNILYDMLYDKSLWRFVLLSIIFIGVRMVYRQLDATFPKYFTREFGDDAPYELITTINPIIILIFVPIIAYVTKNYSTKIVMIIGAYISAMSIISLVIQTSYSSCILFVVILSIGKY
eukprot:GHVL01039175.1.p1 GENE.GHVL01039175.1~~GHVL01039175.1.p1  ORF type:complete len:323 (-),score=31.95 GHVL01039175.1:1109-2023(-)